MKPKLITSPQNRIFKDLQKLQSSRGIQDQGQALFAGDKLLPEIVAKHAPDVTAWITGESGPPPPFDVPWIALSDELYKELDQFGTQRPLAVVRVPEIPPWSASEPWDIGCTLFLAFQNPENVGAVIRSAAAFGVSRVVLLQEAAHPFHPKAMRAAGTALLSTRFGRGPSIKALAVAPARLVALDAGGTSLHDTEFPERFALLPGVEGPGLPAHLAASATVSIPMRPGVESLNAATATAIVLYEWQRQSRLRL